MKSEPDVTPAERRDVRSAADAQAPAEANQAAGQPDTGPRADDQPSPAAAGSAGGDAGRPGGGAAVQADLAAEIEAARAEAAQRHDDWLRALAELDNQRKRSAREIEERTRFTREEMLAEFLTVVDDVERALAALEGPADEPSVQSVVEGVRLIHARLLELLARHDVRAMDCAGAPFDPRFHEAVMCEESSRLEADHVSRVIQQGYWIGDRVLRPARVAVSTRPGAADS